MSKFSSLQDAYQYFEENGGGGGINFFSLKNDRETAVVRFLHEGEDDLDWYIIHEAEIQGKQRKVKCTEQGDCPLCLAGNRPQLKIFMQLIDKREPDKVKVWERGRTFIPIIMSFMQRYGSLSAQPVEVERLGKPGDTKTTYQLYALDKDNKTLQDLPQREQLAQENGFILVKNNADLQAIVQGTYVPDGGNNNQGGGGYNNNQFNQPPQQAFNQAPQQNFNQAPQQQGFNQQQNFNQQNQFPPQQNQGQINQGQQQQQQGIQQRPKPSDGTDIF